MISVKASMEIVIKVETQKDYEDMADVIESLDSIRDKPAVKEFTGKLSDAIKSVQEG